MLDGQLTSMLLLAAGLGLFGFIEPCTVGSSVLFVKYLEGRNRAAKISQALIFMATRALFIGGLGAGIAVLGGLFVDLQKGGWLLLGSVYSGLGVLFILGKGAALSRSIGIGMSRLSGNRGTLALGVVFGLNIPACAAPLIFALLGATALGTGANAAFGFATLAVFGLFLSVPLVVALFYAPMRALLDKVAGLSIRMPFWTGIVFVALGLWSIYFGLFVNLADWV
jgi:cytochrome c-type biogenesis protein